MARTAAALALVVSCACGAPEAPPTTLVATVAYDTLVIVGGPDERNPHFLYANAHPYLIDSTTVAYADEGRIVVANVLTGEGWERSSSRGENGPGEFGAQEVALSPFGGVLHAAGRNGNYASWTADGELIASGRMPSQPYARGREFAWLQGIVDGRLVLLYRGVAMRFESGVDTLPQGIRIYDLKEGHVLDLREGIPDLVERVTVEDASSNYERLSGDGVLVAARGRTIARAMHGQRAITLLDPSGRTTASRELDADLRYLSIDADGRIWAHLLPQGSIVFSSDLSEELFRTDAPGVRDAAGAYLLAVGEGRANTAPMVLMRMRPR
jgi:hypothetical protein